MTTRDDSEPIKIYLDDQTEPFKVAQPPLRFNFNTIQLPDGPHTLRVEASNGLAPPTIKEIPFRVRNGVALTVSGLEQEQTISGQVELIINAYAGSTEVDFEPRRAETPQPVPTWAWVLLLAVIAWTMFYLINPERAAPDATAAVDRASPAVGERIYVDTCARCHGEDGRGRGDARNSGMRVPRLRDDKKYALADSPFDLLTKVVLGERPSEDDDAIPDPDVIDIPTVIMPNWGPILTNEEIVAVVNYTRTSWGHDASTITLEHRRPPREIEKLEERMKDAIENKNANGELGDCCWPKSRRGRPPILFRTDGVLARGQQAVEDAWNRYFEDLGTGKITQFVLTEERYDYDRNTVNQDKSKVIGMGRIFIEAVAHNGQPYSQNGRFIRVYENRVDKAGKVNWSLIFDFADIDMRIGCDVEIDPDCPPDELQPTAESRIAALLKQADGQARGYEDIQEMFRALGRKPVASTHELFWELDYADFIELEFPYSWDEPDHIIKLVEPYDAGASNLIRALLPNEMVIVKLESGATTHKPVERMPKRGPYLDDISTANVAAWVQAGCPEFADKPSAIPMPEGKDEPNGAEPNGKEPPPGPSTGDLGWEGVKQLLADLKTKAPASPHGDFWKDLSYDEFIEFAFPQEWGDEGLIKLVIPWDGANSNLIKGLRDGKNITLTMPDGTTKTTSVKRMPKNKPPMSPEDIQRLIDWIDKGCPEKAGAPSKWPKPGATDTEKPPKEPPPDTPEPPSDAPPPPPPGPDPEPPVADAGEKPVIDIGFARIQEIFKALKRKAPAAAHGNFWKDLSYQEFVAFEFPMEWGEDDMIKLLKPYDAEGSNLIRALRDGKGVVLTAPDGSTRTVNIERMPKGRPPMDPAHLAEVIKWVNAGCPEHSGKPSALPRPK